MLLRNLAGKWSKGGKTKRKEDERYQEGEEREEEGGARGGYRGGDDGQQSPALLASWHVLHPGRQ